MGGDNAPLPNIEGAINYFSLNDSQDSSCKEKKIVLIGTEELIKKELSARNALGLPIEIRNASQVIGMDEAPIEACTKKPDSSIVVGMNLLKTGEIDAFVSTGNSGAMTAAATIILEKLKGVRRPA